MSASDKPQKSHATESGKSLGFRMTEKLLPIFGPAAVGDSTAPVRKTTQEEKDREQDLESELVRKKGADGSTYVEARGKNKPASET